MRLNSVLSIVAAVVLLAACASEQPQPAKPGAGPGMQGQPAPVAGAQIVPGSQADLVANVGDRVFFDYDKSDLRADARAQVEKWAQWLKKYPQNTVTIEGHCDERGSVAYNLGLGDRRANATKDFLVALGVSGDRIKTISYGKERPFCTEHDEACWQQNRRGHLVCDTCAR